jgi:hypothetical protein
MDLFVAINQEIYASHLKTLPISISKIGFVHMGFQHAKITTKHGDRMVMIKERKGSW